VNRQRAGGIVQVPVLETTQAIQTERNTGWLSGLQIDASGAALPGAPGRVGASVLIVQSPELVALR
jgi:hypothetical protein